MYISRLLHTDVQQWIFNPVAELPGFYTIQYKCATSPSLYITTPQSPKQSDLIFVDNLLKNEADGSISKSQLWRFVPVNNDANVAVSVIQNHSGLVIDIGFDNVDNQLWLNQRNDSMAQQFFNDLS